MFFSFLNIDNTVLSIAWKFYRDMEMIDIFIDDNVYKIAFFLLFLYKASYISPVCISKDRTLTDIFFWLFVKFITP